MSVIGTINVGIAYGIMGLYFLIGVLGIVGAIMAVTTREDAFSAADRQPKLMWTAMLFASGLVVMTQLPFLSWIGIVIIGLYWFDVRPQIKDILNGNYGW